MISLLSRLAVIVTLFSLALGACDTCELAILTGGLPDGVVDRPYVFQLAEDCGGDIWFLADGSLPPGISLSEDGVLAGTPTLAGEYLFTIGLQDFYGREVVKGFSLAIRETAALPPS
jgi:hypothetical protein